MTDFIVKKPDIVWAKTDAVVNPANSCGSMGGGFVLPINRAWENIIEQEATSHAPIPVGSAISTIAGYMSCRVVIHVPTMKNHVERSTAKNVCSVTYVAFVCASELGIKSVSLPGMEIRVRGIEKVSSVSFDNLLLYVFEESVKNGKL